MFKPNKRQKTIIENPKYKIGDIILYKNRYEDEDDECTNVFQSKIVEANCLTCKTMKDDTPSWFYYTEEVIKSKADPLEDNDILCKIS